MDPARQRPVGAHNPDLLRTARRNNDYGDWLAVGLDTPRDVLATAYWAHDARLMAELARALGKPERAAHYDRLRDGIAAAFARAYVDDDARIAGDTQTAYLLALHMDPLAPELRARAAERLAADIERHDWHLNSFNHYSLGSVGQWLIEYVAGIRPGRPGYEHVVIAPMPGELASVRATYKSVRGTIASAWERPDGGFHLEVEIPANVTATVVLPSGDVEIGSGRYAFAVDELAAP